MQTTAITVAGLLLTLTLVSCDSSATTPNTDPPSPADSQATAGASTAASSSPEGDGTAGQSDTEKTVLPSGLEYTVLKEGQGDTPKIGSTVLIHCTCRLKNGQVFWNTRTAGVPQREVLSYDRLIAGMLEALLTMKPGERRQLHIPSELGYGVEGNRKVPPRADLDVDLELVSIEP